MTITTAKVKIPPKLIPVFLGDARYRGAFGGRGSGKTQTFAKMTAIRAYQWAMAGDYGVIVCAREFMNSLDESSMAEIKAAIASEPWLAEAFDVGEKYIRTSAQLPGRIEYKFTGLDRNIDSIKSKARVKILWVDEAEPVSEQAWMTAIPSVREHDSEIWVTWNPRSRRSATHKRFRENAPDGAKIVELNWRDNPWFPAVLEMERLQDLAKRPDIYPHVWEGDFEQVVSGAYYAQSLAMARHQNRIRPLSVDPLMQFWTFWDIGTRDHTAIWVVQFIGGRVHCVDHYEAAGQPLAAHLGWLRENGYDKAICILPHDGANVNHISAERFVDHIRSAGFPAEVIANQGKGAAMQRVEAARRMFPAVCIDPDHCAGGLEALAAYHEKKDDKRGIGLGPEHDWSSHSADAFGLIALGKSAFIDVQNDQWEEHYERAERRVLSSTGY
jgi:phage terminase large subunit